ncbi:Acrylyl-CoA reductase AcuI [Planctomycetales bacterium 10988]|nr:Acrylyl-CoA reductase AcuI [Planctomycetales bacterium 10988]
MSETFQAYLVRKQGKDQITTSVETCRNEELAAGDLTVRVHYSSLNYKDQMAASGNPAVARKFPHVPGIDAAGVVESCSTGRFQPGDQVLVTSYELGVERWGGWAERIRVPSDWAIPLPEGLSLAECMMLGTAGLTAAMGVRRLLNHGLQPKDGPLFVTGATGGVGVFAISILSQLGYEVAAISGKESEYDWLQSMGATRCLPREALAKDLSKPLFKSEWAGGYDTVGGEPLASLLRSIKPQGAVACCGVVAGAELPLTVYPFILRGITLYGIDSVWTSYEERLACWHQLAGPWKPAKLTELTQTVTLNNLDQAIATMKAGNSRGRTLVDLTA